MIGKVEVYAVGLVHLSACAPKDMPAEDVVANVNLLHLTGISSRWKIHEGGFKTGHNNPCVCEQDASRLHYLFVC